MNKSSKLTRKYEKNLDLNEEKDEPIKSLGVSSWRGGEGEAPHG